LPHELKATTLGKAIKNLTQEMGIEGKISEQTVFTIWGDAVGEIIAAKTEVLSISKGVLRIKTESAAWKQELFTQRSRIIKRLNAELGKQVVSEIIFS